MMSLFFWPSVCLVYLGFIVLLVDLWFENLGSKVWPKLLLGVSLMVLAVSYTRVIVLRKDPISSDYRIDDQGIIRLFILNPTDDDYHDLDLRVKVDYPADFVYNVVDHSSLPGLTIPPPELSLAGEEGEEILATDDLQHPGVPQAFYANFLRIRCDKPPRHTRLHLTLSVFISRAQKQATVFSVSRVDISGKYSTQFRTFKISQIAEQRHTMRLSY